MTLFADLRHVIYALSDALDLVGVDDVAHGKRVGIMAAECGRVAGLPETETAFLLDLGMLHDIGVSSTRTHCHLVETFDWDGCQGHCEVGHALLKGFGPLEAMAEPVRYHHTRWDALPTSDVDPDTLRAANQFNEHIDAGIGRERHRIVEPLIAVDRNVANLVAAPRRNAGDADFTSDDVREVRAVRREKFQQAATDRANSGYTEFKGFHFR